MGGLKRLNELGVLSQVTTISSVSGGSVVAGAIRNAVALGHISWPPSGEPPQVIEGWDTHVTQPILKVTARNLRTPAWATRWVRGGDMIDRLAHSYTRHVTALNFEQSPSHPRFVLSATDMAFGVNWRFDLNPPNRDGPRMGSYQAGWGDAPTQWPIARAIAASSCFPPVFNPMKLRLKPSDLSDGNFPPSATRDALVEWIGLTDGGVYDNLGLEPVIQSHKWILVSDGGAAMAPAAARWFGSKLLRYASIQGSQGIAVRKRWLIDQYQREARHGAYWSISTRPVDQRSGLPRYPKDTAELIGAIRTDLDRFNDPEAALLVSHGYLQANTIAALFLNPRNSRPGLWDQWVQPILGPMDDTRAETIARQAEPRSLAGRGLIPKPRGNIWTHIPSASVSV